jgi:hypothetical protein
LSIASTCIYYVQAVANSFPSMLHCVYRLIIGQQGILKKNREKRGLQWERLIKDRLNLNSANNCARLDQYNWTNINTMNKITNSANPVIFTRPLASFSTSIPTFTLSNTAFVFHLIYKRQPRCDRIISHIDLRISLEHQIFNVTNCRSQ